jgi:hypothetical protein
MNGPTSKAKETSLLSKQDWYQRLVEAGGVVVFVGLLIEDGPELWEALLQHRIPSRGVIGGIIVAIGVGVEVLFASLVTHTSKLLQEFADARNAEFHERAASAEQRTVELGAETERLRKENNDISMVLSDRMIKDVPGFVEAMRAFAGTEVLIGEVLMGSGNSPESRRLLWVIKNTLECAGWIITGPVSRSMLPDCVTISLTLSEWNADSPCRRAAVALGDWLNDSGIVPLVSLHDAHEGLQPGTLIINVGGKPQTVGGFNALRDGWIANMEELRDQP